MGYTWTDGELITANKLNNTGSGGAFIITATEDDAPKSGGAKSGEVVEEGTLTLDKSYEEILSALESGQIPVIVEKEESLLVSAIPFNKYGGGTITFLDLDIGTTYIVSNKVEVYSDDVEPNKAHYTVLNINFDSSTEENK